MKSNIGITLFSLALAAGTIGCAHHARTAHGWSGSSSRFTVWVDEPPGAEPGKPVASAYFAFDDDRLDAESHATLEALAHRMRTHADERVRIEGNCDQRGGEHYNEELGARRADAAKRYLVKLGVEPRRIDIVTLGASRRSPNTDEWSFAKNRRDDFLIVRR